MVAPGFLQNPEVRLWLNGVEPAWTMLEIDSFNALHDEPSCSNRAIRLEPGLADVEISGSPDLRSRPMRYSYFDEPPRPVAEAHGDWQPVPRGGRGDVQQLGQPVISNGLPLTKIHHAAFDARLIGIDPDYGIHVSNRLLEIHDWPFLELGLKGIAGTFIELPRRTEDRPDRDRLALRFEQFKKSAQRPCGYGQGLVPG